MIDLAAVAARIDALPGWETGFHRDDDGVYLSAINSDYIVVFVWENGMVSSDDMGSGDDLMPLLPVLQIVKEARGE